MIPKSHSNMLVYNVLKLFKPFAPFTGRAKACTQQTLEITGESHEACVVHRILKRVS